MKVKVSEATPSQLNWLVAKITNPEWWEDGYMDGDPTAALDMDDGTAYSPSTDWAQGGPIIEREEISLHTTPKFAAQCMKWDASQRNINGACVRSQFGPTPLIAAMRCYVASKLGEECDIPDELITGE